MLAVPEYRAVIQALLAEGDRARKHFDELMTASMRILYEHPVSDDIRRAVDRVRDAYFNQVGHPLGDAALREKERRLGVDRALLDRFTAEVMDAKPTAAAAPQRPRSP
jgi:hypothetical protein